MIKFTNHNLKKLETLLSELGYTIRYEKGNFQSGYCVVEHQKVIVINKFYDTEGKMNTLFDIMSRFDFSTVTLSEASSKFYKLVKKTAFLNNEDEHSS